MTGSWSSSEAPKPPEKSPRRFSLDVAGHMRIPSPRDPITPLARTTPDVRLPEPGLRFVSPLFPHPPSLPRPSLPPDPLTPIPEPPLGLRPGQGRQKQFPSNKAPSFDVHTRSFGRQSLYNILRGNSLQLFSKKRGGLTNSLEYARIPLFVLGEAWCRAENEGAGWSVGLARGGRLDISVCRAPREASRQAQRRGGFCKSLT